MITWAPQQTQISVFQLLGQDAALVALLDGEVIGNAAPFGDPKIYDIVPDDTKYPYVTIDILPFQDRGNHSKEGWSCLMQINVWYDGPGKGRKQVQLIQNRIDELLHNSELCVEGWNNLGLRRTLVDIVTEDDNQTLHGIQRFNLLLGEA